MVEARNFDIVMPGLVPGIHVFFVCCENVDGRDEPGHDDADRLRARWLA
jgi:hypothetical protein